MMQKVHFRSTCVVQECLNLLKLRHSTTGFSECVVTAETSYFKIVIELLSFYDLERA